MTTDLIKAEFFKTIRFRMLWFAILFPALFPALAIFYSLDTHQETFTANMRYAHEKNPYVYLSTLNFFLFGLLSPIVIAAVIISVNYIERQANGWKYLMMSPFSHTDILTSKIIVSLFYLFLSLLSVFFAHIISAQVFSLMRPDLNIHPSFYDLIYVLSTYIKIWLVSLGIVPILWAVSLFFRSYIVVCIFTSIIGIFISFSYQPFRLPTTTIIAITRTRGEFGKLNKPFGISELMTIGLSDILSAFWFFSVLLLLVLFFKPIMKKHL